MTKKDGCAHWLLVWLNTFQSLLRDSHLRACCEPRAHSVLRKASTFCDYTVKILCLHLSAYCNISIYTVVKAHE